MILLLVRLAWRSLRHRLATSLLLLAAMLSMTSTLTLALSVAEAARSPWDRTFAATGGPDVIANSEDPARLAALSHDPRVQSAIGPFPLVHAVAEVHGWTVPLGFIGRPTLATPIDHPLLVAGSPDLSAAGVVLDRGVAAAVGARVGDTLTVNHVVLTVRGIALSVAQPGFPRYEPGQAWTSPTTAGRLIGEHTPNVHRVELRLIDTTAATTFVTAHTDPHVYLRSWQQTRDDTLQDVTTVRVILLTVTALIAVLALTSVTVLVTIRIDQRRRGFATLKASGATPGQVLGVLLLEQSLIAVVAVVLGLAAGTWLSTLLGSPGADLLATPAPPTLTVTRVLIVTAATAAVLTVASLRGALALRSNTITELAPTVNRSSPRRHRVRAGTRRWALPLPLTLRLGLRFLTRRRGRTTLTILSLALSVALVVAALATQRTLELQLAPSPAAATGTALQTIADHHASDRIRYLVDLFAVLFTTLALVNLAASATFAAREAAPTHAVMRAAGATPRQTLSSFLTTHTVAAALAAVVGIPAGLALFHSVYALTNTSPVPASNPTTTTLTAIAAATLVLAALLTAAPAQWLARRPIAATLSTD